jgi:hypothetical protein
MEPDKEAKVVYRRHNELLPVLTRPQVGGPHNSCTSLKIYYYCVTVPGHGSICAALRSGTRNMPEPKPEGFSYWFDELVVLGLASEDQQRALQQKIWQVRMMPSCELDYLPFLPGPKFKSTVKHRAVAIWAPQNHNWLTKRCNLHPRSFGIEGLRNFYNSLGLGFSQHVMSQKL